MELLVEAVIIGLGISVFGLWRGWLVWDGSLALTVVSISIYTAGGRGWFLTGLVVFAGGSLLTKYRLTEKERWLAEAGKGAARDSLQVLANGMVPTLLALFSLLVGKPLVLVLGYVSSLASANADTWQTELGVLSRKPPRLFLSWKPVARGTSGAVSLLGTGAGVLGAITLLVASLIFMPDFRDLLQSPRTTILAFAIILTSGLCGTFFDSLLGATVQAKYWCHRCEKQTEARMHHCGQQTTLRSGIPWLTNDLVNLVANSFAAVMAIVLGWLAFKM